MYARRWESPKTGKSGYRPACSNERVNESCDKCSAKRADSPSRSFLLLTDVVAPNPVAGKSADD
ncbi:hypothetical protein LLG39_17435 [bacterium]|nr:hypothetical protein [bacterium]